jgi:hypothetical protein|tara:strand:+ start:948 stop:1364 length:417 start_codon:yes stop_codon:yes gene_type:complete
MRDLGHWSPDLDFNVDDYFGFVYKITNKNTNRSYIGRKQFHSYTRKKIKGKKNRKKIVRESDWKTYTGSCEPLNEEIVSIGKENFTFTILKLCITKRDLGYTETQLQFKENVLESTFADGTRKYYNNNIMSRWFATEG